MAGLEARTGAGGVVRAAGALDPIALETETTTATRWNNIVAGVALALLSLVGPRTVSSSSPAKRPRTV